MLDNNTITINDGTSDRTFKLVFREGSESKRVEEGVESSEALLLRIANTINRENKDAKNRHLAQISWDEVDATTGATYKGSVHIVITRDKLVSDASIATAVTMVSNLMTSSGLLEELLIGAN